MSPIHHNLDSEDWEYLHINSTYSGIDFRLVDAERGLYEAVVVRCSDAELSRYQPVFWIYPQLSEWSMSDLFTKHPTKPDLWRYEGRRDDMIVLDFGHNFHPTYYEAEILAKDPLIRSALIVGNGRPRLAVIIELSQGLLGSDTRENLLEKIWPTVETCNRRASKGGQISKDYVIFASPEKPFLRAGKGTVQRAATVEQYKEEIGRLYATTNDH